MAATSSRDIPRTVTSAVSPLGFSLVTCNGEFRTGNFCKVSFMVLISDV